MSDEQKREKPDPTGASDDVTQKPQSEVPAAGEGGQAGGEATAKPAGSEAKAAPMSGEPTAAPGADITKAGGAGEPPGGYKEAKPEAEGAAVQADEASGESPAAASGDAPAGEAAAPVDAEREAKLKAAAEARAARAAARAAQAGAEPGDAPAGEAATPEDAEKEAKAKAAAEARAARASARAAKTAEPEGPKEPSPSQPLLDRLVAILKERHPDCVEEAFVNEKGGHVPYVVVKGNNWLSAAEVLKHHAELKMDYLRNVSGIDMETHMEVAYHLISLELKQDYVVKVKTNRETPSVPSVTGIWPTANWNEREIYDLFGIDFPGHPDLRRIMMADDWVGHPLRKDYEPLDPEV
ncbi:NAD(P)H-quinone oxidoreductase subunit J, chloroplastic [Paenibacillus solanacearum]|uniref:NADH-quinone oxidoreductase subunit C n=1 Tax=Paenibacillus solanacearum TaxID=2048548 RepID=A0A916K320_9BACL|nr:NADH-quinone oxidoreductase subunit C [Paenibacillus solanacearum]CAG7634376.1 NAD(P)H-quinone oxidoreductase subunit J, chloroplastic [Paenibacillus solanacearum]